MIINPYRYSTGGGGGGSFDPSTLSLTAWYDFSDASTMFQDTAGTTPAILGGAEPTNFIGRVNDKSGNGNHLLLASGASSNQRPRWLSASGLSYLNFDAVNATYLECAGLTLTQSNDIALAGQTAAFGRHFYDGISARQAMLGNSSNIATYAGSAVVNGAVIAVDTNYVFTARFDGASSLIRTNGVASGSLNPGSSGMSGFRLGTYQSTIAHLVGRIYGILIRDTVFTAPELANVEAYLAAKAGVTL